MAFNSAVNRYVELVSTKPAIIAPSDAQPLTAIRAQINARIEGYRRIFIEIGSGSGAHLTAMAMADPEAYFIGFELRYKRCFKTAEKAERLGLPNLSIVQLNASHIPDLFENEQVDGFMVLFPDPWDKRKWRKHRILNPLFLSVLNSRLKPGGNLLYKTDHREYFDWILEVIQQSNLFEVRDLSFDLYASTLERKNIPSEFEKLFRYKGLPIYMVNMQKNRKNP